MQHPVLVAHTPETAISLFKFGAPTPLGSEFAEFHYGNTFQREYTGDQERLLVAPQSHPIALLIELSRLLPEPLRILYVLLLSRTGMHEAGRYQSQLFDRFADVEAVINDYQPISRTTDAIICGLCRRAGVSSTISTMSCMFMTFWDEAEELLRRLGMRPEEEKIAFPTPHSHHYHAVYDIIESDLLRNRDWTRFPLVDGVDNR